MATLSPLKTKCHLTPWVGYFINEEKKTHLLYHIASLSFKNLNVVIIVPEMPDFHAILAKV